MLCSDWLSDSTLDCDWFNFSHVNHAIIMRIAFFTSEKITHIKLFLQCLFHKILAIYAIKFYIFTVQDMEFLRVADVCFEVRTVQW